MKLSNAKLIRNFFSIICSIAVLALGIFYTATPSKAANYALSTQFSAGSPTVVATHAQRTAAGLSIWPDGNFGFYQYSGQNRLIAPNSGSSGITQTSPSSLITTVVDSSVPVGSLKEPANYAGGGPIYNDTANNRLLLFYHGEVWPGGDSTKTWAFIGMAKSTDGGATFTDLGRIITPNIQYTSPTYQGPADVLGGPYMIKDGYFYVYFKDQLDDGLYGQSINYTVARASVSDVINAANTGGVASFQKYYNNSFSQPGIAGLSQNIVTGFPQIRWADVIYLQSIGQYAMVFSTGDATEWWHLVSTSSNGINWVLPTALYGKLSRPGLYLSAFSGDYANPRTATGNSFTFYRVNQYDLTNSWANADVESMTINFTGSSGGGSSSSSSATLAGTGKNQIYAIIGISAGISVLILLIAFAIAKLKPKTK